MRGVVILLLLVLVAGCASPRSRDKKSELTFEAVKHVFASAPSQSQILEKYGEPGLTDFDGDHERWRYLQNGVKNDRLQFLFDDSKRLVQVIWLPMPEDKEFRLEAILSQYPNGTLKPVAKRRLSPHHFATETTYSDGTMIFILNDDTTKEIQAVVWSNQAPSNNQRPMTSR